MPAPPEVSGRRIGTGHNNPPEQIDDPLQLLTKRELAMLLGVNAWTLDRWRKQDSGFPKPIWISDTTPRWPRGEIAAWYASRQRGGVSPDWTRSTRRQRRAPMRRRRNNNN